MRIEDHEFFFYVGIGLNRLMDESKTCRFEIATLPKLTCLLGHCFKAAQFLLLRRPQPSIRPSPPRIACKLGPWLANPSKLLP